MKYFLVSFLVSSSLFSLNAYGAPTNPHLDCAESYVGEAEAMRRSALRGDSKKHDESIRPADSDAADEGSIPQTFDDFFRGVGMPQHRTQILSYLNFRDRFNLASTCPEAYKLALQDNLKTDPRRLQDKTWVGGPQRGTPDLYRINAAVFHALKHAIIAVHVVCEKKEGGGNLGAKERMRLLEPISKVVGYLESGYDARFPRAIERVNAFLSGVYVSLKHEQPFSISPMLEVLAGTEENTGERGLMRFHSCYFNSDDFNPRKGAYADTEKDFYLMDIVTRDWFFTSQKEAIKEGLSIDPSFDWDKVIKHGIYTTIDDFREAAEANYRKGNIARTLEITERVLKEFPGLVKAEDVGNALGANKQVGNIARVMQLCDRLIDDFPDTVTADDLRGAALENHEGGNNPRALELWDKLINFFPERVTAADLRFAAWANREGGNNARALELWDNLICSFRKDVTADDIRNGIDANEQEEYNGHALKLRDMLIDDFPDTVTAEEVRHTISQHEKARHSDRVLKLVDRLIDVFPDTVTVEEIRHAITQHEVAGPSERVLKLWNMLVDRFPDTVTPEEVRQAAEANAQNECEDRELEMRERLLKDFPDQVEAQDFALAGRLHFTKKHFTRALESFEEAYKPSKDYAWDLFAAFHLDLDRYAQERDRLLGENFMTPEEKSIYSSIVHGSPEEIRQRIDCYTEDPALTCDWSDQIRDCLVHISFILHYKDD